MYLNEVTIGGLISIFILLMNVALRYYVVFQKGVRISNLVIVKLFLRASILLCLILILLASANHRDNIKTRFESSLILYLSIPENQNKLIFTESTISKLTEIANAAKNEKIGLVILNANKNLGRVIIPTTNKRRFINLLRTEYFKNRVDYNLQQIDFNQTNTKYLNIFNSDLSVDLSLIAESNEPVKLINHFTNIFEITSLKFYLLILTIVLVSADLIFKLKILKI